MKTAAAALLVAFALMPGSASARALTSSSLVEHWDGASWSPVAVPSGAAGLTAVVAPSASDVWAFGTSRVALHYAGASWQRVKLPVEPDSAAPAIWGAAATSPSDVWAVGSVSPTNAPEHATIAHWNGSNWQLVPGPPPRSELYGITALSAKNAWAVGDVSVETAGGLERVALTLHWNGTTWTQMPTPNPAPSSMPAGLVHNVLNAVSGSSPHDMWAVGSYYVWANGVRGDRALVLHWDGHSWARVPNPSVVAGHASGLNGVTTPSASGVWAVGWMNHRNARHALTERWDGSHWAVVHAAGPGLTGVSALGADDAWASGGYSRGGVVLHWDGHFWAAATTLGTAGGVTAVAETSPTDVWAVGSSNAP